jgi:hypothetical protein
MKSNFIKLSIVLVALLATATQGARLNGKPVLSKFLAQAEAHDSSNIK